MQYLKIAVWLALLSLAPAGAALAAPCFEDGSYELTTTISSDCTAIGTWTIESWDITDTGGGTLQVDVPGTGVPTMTGTWNCTTGDFSASSSALFNGGSCTVFYDLSGTFSGGDSFTGELLIGVNASPICLGILAGCGGVEWAPGTPISTDGNLAGGSTAAPLVAGTTLELLAQPNPFRESLDLRFVLPNARETRLTIHDAAGRLVATLVHGGVPAGQRTAVWNGRDAAGSPVAPGVYFARLEAGGIEETRSVVLLR
jgi:hypothetical protein